MLVLILPYYPQRGRERASRKVLPLGSSMELSLRQHLRASLLRKRSCLEARSWLSPQRAFYPHRRHRIPYLLPPERPPSPPLWGFPISMVIRRASSSFLESNISVAFLIISALLGAGTLDQCLNAFLRLQPPRLHLQLWIKDGRKLPLKVLKGFCFQRLSRFLKAPISHL